MNKWRKPFFALLSLFLGDRYRNPATEQLLDTIVAEHKANGIKSRWRYWEDPDGLSSEHPYYEVLTKSGWRTQKTLFICAAPNCKTTHTKVAA